MNRRRTDETKFVWLQSDVDQKEHDQGRQPADAIEYYNGYLDLEPKGENAEKVKDRISALLEGGDRSGSAGP